MDKTLDFKLGAEVRCRDKSCGRLTKLVVTPVNQQLTHLIVESGFLFKRATVIPVDRVEKCFAGEIDLSLQSDEIQEHPEYQETVVGGVADWHPPHHIAPEVPLSTTWEGANPEPALTPEKIRTGVDPNSLLLSADTAINGLDGHVGYLNRVMVSHDNYFITHLVVCRGTLVMDYRVIPAHWLETWGETDIQIKATNDEVNTLPEYFAHSAEPGPTQSAKGELPKEDRSTTTHRF